MEWTIKACYACPTKGSRQCEAPCATNDILSPSLLPYLPYMPPARTHIDPWPDLALSKIMRHKSFMLRDPHTSYISNPDAVSDTSITNLEPIITHLITKWNPSFMSLHPMSNVVSPFDISCSFYCFHVVHSRFFLKYAVVDQQVMTYSGIISLSIPLLGSKRCVNCWKGLWERGDLDS